MEISSDLLIGKQSVHGTNGSIKGINAATGEPLAPAFGGASLDQLEQACALAWQASDIYRELPLETRATFLETIAQNILDIGDAGLVEFMPRMEGTTLHAILAPSKKAEQQQQPAVKKPVAPPAPAAAKPVETAAEPVQA